MAGGVALCAIVVYLLWPRADVAAVRLGALRQSLAHAQNSVALIAPVTNALPTLSPPDLPSDDADWEKLRARIMALSKGKKVEVCGLSDLDAALFLAEHDEENGLTLNRSTMGKSAANAALAEASAKLVQSRSPPEQALGLYVQADLVTFAATEAQAITYENCIGDELCRSKSAEARQQVTAAAADPLAKLALATRDPGIYAAAVYACRGARIGACESIGYTGWATLEPDNAAVWAVVAHDASTRKDIAARDDALRHVAAAGGYGMRIPSMATVLEAESVKALSPLLQSIVGGRAIGLSASESIRQSHALSGICLRGETMTEGHKSLCEKLANKVLETDKTVYALSIATAIAQKAGWDAARIQALRDEKTVVMGLLYDLNDTSNTYSCQSLAKFNQWARVSLLKGERGVARERIAESGKTLTELAEQYRKAYPDSVR